MLLAHLALTALLAAAPQNPRPFTAEDLNAMDRITNPQVSPDGKTVVFEVRVTDLAADKGRFDLWLASVDGKQVRQLTAHEANDTGPQWNPDGSSVLFLSTRSGSPGCSTSSRRTTGCSSRRTRCAGTRRCWPGSPAGRSESFLGTPKAPPSSP